MSDLLPLFPLPNVVLFPNVFLPLHIFEPRYRDMVADALASDRMIGMVLLRPGWDRALPSRRAEAEPLRDSALDAADRSVIRSQRSRLESMLGSSRSNTGDP